MVDLGSVEFRLGELKEQSKHLQKDFEQTNRLLSTVFDALTRFMAETSKTRIEIAEKISESDAIDAKRHEEIAENFRELLPRLETLQNEMEVTKQKILVLEQGIAKLPEIESATCRLPDIEQTVQRHNRGWLRVTIWATGVGSLVAVVIEGFRIIPLGILERVFRLFTH